MPEEKTKGPPSEPAPQAQPDKTDVKEFTKGETLPTIDVNVPMPSVKPAKPAEASPAPEATPSTDSGSSGGESTGGGAAESTGGGDTGK